MTTPTTPRLTPEMVGDDGALTDAIPEELTSPNLAPFTAEVLRRQRTLRAVLTDEQVQVYLALEEAVNDRIAAESSCSSVGHGGRDGASVVVKGVEGEGAAGEVMPASDPDHLGGGLCREASAPCPRGPAASGRGRRVRASWPRRARSRASGCGTLPSQERRSSEQ